MALEHTLGQLIFPTLLGLLCNQKKIYVSYMSNTHPELGDESQNLLCAVDLALSSWVTKGGGGYFHPLFQFQILFYQIQPLSLKMILKLLLKMYTFYI